MNYKSGVLLGRLSNGFESDHGTLVHAVQPKKTKMPPCPLNDWGRKVIENDTHTTMVGLCGAKPGKRSVGWNYEEREVTCPRCLARMEKIKAQ